LPIQNTALWFLDKLAITERSTLVIVDDSQSILNLWQQRICEHLNINTSIEYFDNPASFLKWYRSNGEVGDYIYLIDYEFTNDSINGIDIIQQMKYKDQKNLVTSYAQDFNLQKKCLSLNIKLLPKYFIAHIPIFRAMCNPEVILIESDLSLQQASRFRAKEREVPTIIFGSLNDFYADFRIYGTTPSLYISDEFVKELTHIKNLGFKNIFLTTYDIDKYESLTDIKVVDKNMFLSTK